MGRLRFATSKEDKLSSGTMSTAGVESVNLRKSRDRGQVQERRGGRNSGLTSTGQRNTGWISRRAQYHSKYTKSTLEIGSRLRPILSQADQTNQAQMPQYSSGLSHIHCKSDRGKTGCILKFTAVEGDGGPSKFPSFLFPSFMA